MSKIISAIVALLTFLFSFFNLGGDVNFNGNKTEDFKPTLRFVVSSDAHIMVAGDDGCKRVAKMIKTGYSVAEKSDYNSLDAVVLVGDSTDRGLKSQYKALAGAVKSSIKGNTAFMGTVAKSHDSVTYGREMRDYFTSLFGMPSADFHNVINGFHFIGISVSEDESVHYSERQLQWLREQLDTAYNDDPSKPIFVFQHEHIYGTVFGSMEEDGWGVKYFTDILSKYPNVIDISGHSHYPANDPRSIWQDGFTAINDGGLAYYELTFDGKNKIHPENGIRNMAQCLIVEVDELNSVRVFVYDLLAQKVRTTYFIENPADKQSFTYRHDTRKENAKAPIFADGAELEVKKIGTTVSVKAPAAQPSENDVVLCYSYTIKNSEGKTVESKRVLTDYYKTSEPFKLSFSKVLSCGSYTIEVFAEDAWGKVSEPLTAQVKI